MGQIETFEFKLASMRKPDNFVIYPGLTRGMIMFQGRRSIGLIDPATCKGVLNYKGNNSKYFHHLITAESFEFPKEFARLCDEFTPKTGDKIGPGITLG